MTSPLRRPAAWTAMAAALWLGACTLDPTPYQPLGDAGGYEEARLQPNVYRVSFRGNRATPETTVLDYLYLRCAELTKDAGFPYFVIVEDYGRTKTDYAPRPGMDVGVGVGTYSRGTFWGMGLSHGRDYDVVLSYNLAVFVIRMLSAEEAAQRPNAFEVDYLIQSLRPKVQPPPPGKP